MPVAPLASPIVSVMRPKEPELSELSASLHDSGRSGLVTSVVMLDRARRTDYDPQDAVGCTGRDATNLPAI